MASYVSLYKWLRNGSSRDANVDGSSAAKNFEYTVAAGDSLDWSRLIIYMQDTGSLDAALYGNGAVLTNGIKVEVIDTDDSTVVLDLLDGETIKSNGEWKALCHDWLPDRSGTGDEVASIRWTVSAAGKPIRVSAGQKVRVTIQDNLTVLVKHYFQIQGILT